MPPLARRSWCVLRSLCCPAAALTPVAQPAAEDALLLRRVEPAAARVALSEKDKAQHVALTDDGLGAQSSKARQRLAPALRAGHSRPLLLRGTALCGALTALPPARGTVKCASCTWVRRGTHELVGALSPRHATRAPGWR